LPHGYASIDYIVLAPQASSTLATLPTLKAALEHSRVLKSFGDGITARVVIKPHTGSRHRAPSCVRRGPTGGFGGRCRHGRCLRRRARNVARSCETGRS